MPADFEPRSLADTVEIAPGVAMPRLGLGTYKSDEGPEVEGAIAADLEWATGSSTPPRSTATRRASAGRCARVASRARTYFVTTKLWNSDQGYESALKACDASLGTLRTGLRRPLPRSLAVAQAHARHLASDGGAARFADARARSASATSSHTTSTSLPSSRRPCRRSTNPSSTRGCSSPTFRQPVPRSRDSPAGVGAGHAGPRRTSSPN